MRLSGQRRQLGNQAHRLSGYAQRPCAVPGAVLWTKSSAEDGYGTVLPDGCMDLIYHGGSLFVAGPDTEVQRPFSRAGERYLAVRFAPGQAPAVLGLRAAELRDSKVDLGELWPDRAVRMACEQIAERGAQALESLVLHRYRATEADPVISAVASAADAGAGVDELAALTGYSARQLHRRCLHAFGYGQKTLTRILRLQRALALARDGIPLGEVAAVSGYADQAHLSRDVKALTGSAPGVLLRAG